MKTSFRLMTAGAALALTIPMASAQNAISDAIEDRLSPGNRIDSRDFQSEDAIRSGIRGATRSAIQGNSFDQVVRDGINQGLQSTYSDRQPNYGPQYNNGYGQPYNQGYNQGQGYVQGRSATVYRDEQGRLFHLDGQGRAVYFPANQPQYSQQPNRSQWNDGYNQSYSRSYQDQRMQSSGQVNAQAYDRSQYQADRNTQYSAQANQGGRLGVAIEETDQGVRVIRVARGSAAAQAGIREGDVIITADGQKIESAGWLSERIASADDNAQVALTVKRNGQEQELTATLNEQSHSQSGDRRSNNNRQQMDRDQTQFANRVDRLEREMSELRRAIASLRSDLNLNQATEQDASTESAASVQVDRRDANRRGQRDNDRADQSSRDETTLDVQSRVDGSNDAADARSNRRNNRNQNANTDAELNADAEINADAEVTGDTEVESNTEVESAVE
ncbi:PDZ domain-containing protein [Stieleria sp.]|uniref:PDZ domain-containing protein n=1 Tax=Stieleria sp. TaxID=2795976 RepID=UPI0035615837